MWNYLLEMRDKKTREVTKEWSIQSNATRNRCFTPDFPISGGKTLLERNRSALCQNCWILYHIKFSPAQSNIQHGIVPILLNDLFISPYSARFLMLCSPQSHVSAADHATSSEVHTRNISSDTRSRESCALKHCQRLDMPSVSISWLNWICINFSCRGN